MIKILGNNKDKFGFYQIGQYQTYSKMEAIELHRRIRIHPHWNFNEVEFSKYDWTVEPVETLDELYAKRARQIRESYDHVVLFYSGGADSSNIVNTFVNNGIHFDEIATYNFWSADSDPNNFFNSEQLQVSYPRIKQLQNQGIDFKHRRIDLSEIASKILTNDQYRLNRAYYGSARWGVSHLAKGYIREIIPEYQRIIESGKKLVFVWGCDKPRLYKENNRYCVKFLDVVDSGISCRTQLINNEYEYDELFYWAPESVDIICKQGHVLKRFFEKYKIYKEDRYYSDSIIDIPNINNIFDNRNTEDGMSYRNLINTLIYPGFNDQTFTAGKPTSLITSLRDNVFNKDQSYKIQVERLKSHISQIDPYWLNDPSDIEKGIKMSISPAYYLE
jgi:hypothetical protein